MKFSLDKLVALPFIYLLALPLLDSAFKDYEGEDSYGWDIKIYISIFIVSLFIVMLFVLYHSQENDKTIKFLKSFAYGLFFSFLATFYINLVKDQTIFYINKSFAKKDFKEKFVIIDTWSNEQKNQIKIESLSNDYFFIAKDKISLNNFSKIKKGDTITVNMSIGLLNKPFLSSGNLEIIKE
jgi:hypothetical protein